MNKNGTATQCWVWYGRGGPGSEKEQRQFIHPQVLDGVGASDHVFILCAMLGFRICPRLRDFPDRKLAAFAAASASGDLSPIIGRRIKEDVIREHWDDILRLVASLKAGTVLPSTMLKRLAAFQRQNQLDLALQEPGRIERSLFMLDWLESPQPGNIAKRD